VNPVKTKPLWDQLFSSDFALPYLGLYNGQDFAQILYLVGGVHIINRNNVFHSFSDPEFKLIFTDDVLDFKSITQHPDNKSII
jgi:hypothetical protein